MQTGYPRAEYSRASRRSSRGTGRRGPARSSRRDRSGRLRSERPRVGDRRRTSNALDQSGIVAAPTRVRQDDVRDRAALGPEPLRDVASARHTPSSATKTAASAATATAASPTDRSRRPSSPLTTSRPDRRHRPEIGTDRRPLARDGCGRRGRATSEHQGGARASRASAPKVRERRRSAATPARAVPRCPSRRRCGSARAGTARRSTSRGRPCRSSRCPSSRRTPGCPATPRSSRRRGG